MALSLDPATKLITIPQADLTLVVGQLYSLDTDQFRKDVMTLLASEPYAWMDDAYVHNTQVTVAGTTYARTIEMINGYSVQFEFTGSAYSVRLEGSNNNLFDVENGILVPTSLVTVIPTNSAGLIVSGGIGVETATQVAELHGQVRRSIFVDTNALVNGNGYQQTPYNNWTSAIDDAEATGITSIHLEADATVDRQIKNFEIYGQGLPQLDLNGQSMDGSVIRLCNVTGTQGGVASMILFDCQMNNVVDFNGAGSLIGGVGAIAFRNGGSSILNQLVQFSTVSVDLSLTLGGAATNVEISNASGSFSISNMDNANDKVHMHIDHGEITLDASCTAGEIHLSGSAKLIDNSAGATVITSGLVEPNKLLTVPKFLGLK